jgi:hypothetical protein
MTAAVMLRSHAAGSCQSSERQMAEVLQGITPAAVAHMREELLAVITTLADAAAVAAVMLAVIEQLR